MTGYAGSVRTPRLLLLGFLLGIGILLAGGTAVAAADAGESGVSRGSSSSDAASPASSASSGAGRTERGGSGDSSPSRGVRAGNDDDHHSASAVDRPSDRVERRADGGQAAGVSTAPAQADSSTPTGGRVLEAATRGQNQDPKQSLSALSADLARSHNGVEPSPRADVTPPQPVGIHGDPFTNTRYWHRQEVGCPTCVLMSVASVVGQLRSDHVMPSQREIIDLAKSTDSDAKPGFKIFEPGGTGSHWGTYYIDAVKLLETYGIDAVNSEFTRNQADAALKHLTSALDDRAGVIVSIRPDTLYDTVIRMRRGEDVRTLKPAVGGGYHAVVVTGFDETRRIVFVNDSDTDNGAGLMVPLDAFLRAWQTSRYLSVVARPRPAATLPQLTIAA